MRAGTLVRPTHEAIVEQAFGSLYSHKRITFNPGDGTVISESAPMPGCVIVRFRSGARMVNTYWLDVAQ